MRCNCVQPCALAPAGMKKTTKKVDSNFKGTACLFLHTKMKPASGSVGAAAKPYCVPPVMTQPTAFAGRQAHTQRSKQPMGGTPALHSCTHALDTPSNANSVSSSTCCAAHDPPWRLRRARPAGVRHSSRVLRHAAQPANLTHSSKPNAATSGRRRC
jgi:hypothetical protein